MDQFKPIRIPLTGSLRAALHRYMESRDIPTMERAVLQLVVYGLIERGCY